MLARSWQGRKCSSAGGSWSSSEGAASRATCRAGRDGCCSRSSSRTATGRSTREEVIEALWPDGRDGGLAPLLSKVRRVVPLDGLRPDRAGSLGRRRGGGRCGAPRRVRPRSRPATRCLGAVAGGDVRRGTPVPRRRGGAVDRRAAPLARRPARARGRGVRRGDARRRRHRARGGGRAGAPPRRARAVPGDRATGS